MVVDYLLIGQGISGTWLSYFLRQQGKSFIVIDNNSPVASSRIAAGVINPVTGRRHVEVWMADEILPFAYHSYLSLGKELGFEIISQKNIIDLFPTPQMRVSFMQRVEEKADYVLAGKEDHRYSDWLRYDFGYGEIDPVYIVHLDLLLPTWREQLISSNELLAEEFEIGYLQVRQDHINYKDIQANAVIFCDGISSTTNPYFELLPFAPNKGEVLIAEIPDLPATHIYKKGTMLVPLNEKGYWWVGSSYSWEFDDSNPTTFFRERTEALLKDWLKVPFAIKEHLAGVRPATLERRPFVGLHPNYKTVGILNGMGTKGCSLAPFFAQQLTELLCNEKTIHPEADVQRFRKILSRKRG